MIDIPVDEYVKKFIEAEYGPEVIVSRRHYIGSMLYVMVERQKKGERIIRPQGEAMLRVTVTKFQSKCMRSCHLSSENSKIFNESIKKLFRDRLFTYLDAKLELRKQARIQKKKEIERFCSSYGIGEDDVARDSLYMAYYRHRKKSNK